MATQILMMPQLGAVWLKGLQLWADYADGVYNSWDWSTNGGFATLAWDVTVGLVAGGTDTYTLVAMDIESAFKVPLAYIVGSPGWRQGLGQPYPDILPDGSDCVTAFDSGPRGFRRSLIVSGSGSPAFTTGDAEGGGQYGVTLHYWWSHYFVGLALVTDVVGVIHGDFSGDDMLGYPTDMIGRETPVAQVTGGGPAIDLAETNGYLRDIALRDVTYTTQNGGAVWNMRGRVNT